MGLLEKTNRTLILVAAGKGKRLSKYFFTKTLLPLYNISIIEKIIEFWGAKETIIVCNGENIDVIKRYTNNKYKYIIEDCVGSAFSVLSGMRASSYDNVIVSWCDVILKNKIEICNKNYIFTDSKIECRYNGNTGGFVGIFVFNKKNITTKFFEKIKNIEVDFLDIIQLNDFEELPVDIIDIGDEKKYTSDLMSVDNPIRSFNKIIIEEDKVTKYCNNPLIKKAENNWYRKLSGKLDFVPTPISYNPLVLKKINGSCIFYKTEPLFDLANKIHSSMKSIKANKEDCFDMYIDKTIRRLNNIDFLFPFSSQFYVNGKACLNPISILNKINIDDIVPERFHPIHGDLTTSNVLWENNKPFVIDPRGIFGKTFLYGDKDYDIAKIYYSKTNWHLLNQGKLIPNIIDSSSFNIEMNYFNVNKKIDFLLAIIWLSVVDYVRSNVISSLYSYLFGSYLLNMWVEIYKE